jgi:hypothetical protein
VQKDRRISTFGIASTEQISRLNILSKKAARRLKAGHATAQLKSRGDAFQKNISNKKRAGTDAGHSRNSLLVTGLKHARSTSRKT